MSLDTLKNKCVMKLLFETLKFGHSIPASGRIPEVAIRASARHLRSTTADGPEIRRSPVEVGSLPFQSLTWFT